MTILPPDVEKVGDRQYYSKGVPIKIPKYHKGRPVIGVRRLNWMFYEGKHHFIVEKKQ